MTFPRKDCVKERDHRIFPAIFLFSVFSLAWLILFFWNIAAAAQEIGTPSCPRGPLRADASNSRYFVDGCGKAVYLTGSHTHLSFKNSRDARGEVASLDYERYLDLMEGNGHNFMRMWSGWELTMFEPQPWKRTGPGLASDGKPKFDLTQLDPAYFERLRSRVVAARERGIYVSIMLFEEWLLRFVANSAAQHPFGQGNNVNGVSGDRNGDGLMLEAHRLGDARITAIQEAYIRKVVDTVNDLDNVLYEVSNESEFPDSASWQYHVIRFVKNYQAAKPNQHPVGMSSAGFSSPYDDLDDLLKSPADWIAPGRPLSLAYDYLNDPPTLDVAKVIISDSDHLAKEMKDFAWIWKSLTRGLHPALMDSYPPLHTLNTGDVSSIRKNLGYARMYAERMDLLSSQPRNDISSTQYALVDPGVEYLIYQPSSGHFTVNVASGDYTFEWFDPSTGTVAGAGSITAQNGGRTFSAPFSGPAVLYVKRKNG